MNSLSTVTTMPYMAPYTAAKSLVKGYFSTLFNENKLMEKAQQISVTQVFAPGIRTSALNSYVSLVFTTHPSNPRAYEQEIIDKMAALEPAHVARGTRFTNLSGPRGQLAGQKTLFPLCPCLFGLLLDTLTSFFLVFAGFRARLPQDPPTELRRGHARSVIHC